MTPELVLGPLVARFGILRSAERAGAPTAVRERHVVTWLEMVKIR